MALEKACSLEAPTTEAEVNELIDFTFAELNRRVGRAGFSPGQRVFVRQLRLPSSLLEDDFIDPYMISQDATHKMRRSEALRMAAAHGCKVAADRRAMSTASHSRQRKLQLAPVAGEPVFVHRRKDGAQGWCGPGVCVLSEEPKPGRNGTVWVHMRDCLHKCNRTQVRPATKEAEGIETVSSLILELTEAVREGRTRHFADITDEGDPEDDEPVVVEGDVMDVRLGRPHSQPEPEELNAPANSNAPSQSSRSETHAEPEAEASTSAGTDMETGVGDQRDRHGRWMPIRGERTMNIQKAREERRSFHVGGGETKLPRRRKQGRWNLFDCVGQGKHAARIILSQPTERRRGILEPPFCLRTNAVFESNRNRMARSTRFQSGDHHRLHASGCDERKHSERVISSRLVLR